MVSKLIVVPIAAIVGVSHLADPAVDYSKAESAFKFEGSRWSSSRRPANTSVDRIVIHSSYAKAKPRKEWFERTAIFAVWRAEKDSNKNSYISVHYFIGRDGKVHQLVPEAEVANHAKGYNSRSIGVELAGIADEFVKEAIKEGASESDLLYTDEQYASLSSLLTDVKTRVPNVKAIRHSEIYEKNEKGEYKARKSDPGSKFDEKKITTAIEWITSHKGE